MLKLKLQYFGHFVQRADSFEKTLMLGGMGAGGEGDDRGRDGWMVYQLNGHEFEQAPGVGDEQGSLLLLLLLLSHFSRVRLCATP